MNVLPYSFPYTKCSSTGRTETHFFSLNWLNFRNWLSVGLIVTVNKQSSNSPTDASVRTSYNQIVWVSLIWDSSSNYAHASNSRMSSRQSRELDNWIWKKTSCTIHKDSRSLSLPICSPTGYIQTTFHSTIPFKREFLYQRCSFSCISGEDTIETCQKISCIVKILIFIHIFSMSQRIWFRY